MKRYLSHKPRQSSVLLGVFRRKKIDFFLPPEDFHDGELMIVLCRLIRQSWVGDAKRRRLDLRSRGLNLGRTSEPEIAWHFLKVNLREQINSTSDIWDASLCV